MTATLKLVIGNKNYSSWSMRPWVLLRQAGIDFEEIQLKFDDNAHARGIESYSPTGQVPVLIVDGAPAGLTAARPAELAVGSNQLAAYYLLLQTAHCKLQTFP